MKDLRERYRDQALERGHSPRDVDLLLADLLGKPITYVVAHGEIEMDPAPLEALLVRRWGGEPLQYIRGRTEFYSREFLVDDRALIPRPDTEVLVETALDFAPRGARVVDIGTGTGCIAITMERERPDLRVLAIDLSIDALALAACNRARLESRIALAASDLLASTRGVFDLIVSNPPYIPLDEYEGLATEVRDHEPRMALTPGPQGTEIIERILDESRERLAPNGRVMLEIGYGQDDAVRALAEANGFDVETIVNDLAAIPRAVVLSAHGR
ncbi:MAG TPA: peptide chain release factor N(5)-glutamine methyltransferase [Thermoanaerobaculia bacterium]|nr:peptide chain release factor N(5)-glutamine methyltransferase [Thermoanaerobaculia bacterium]